MYNLPFAPLVGVTGWGVVGIVDGVVGIVDGVVGIADGVTACRQEIIAIDPHYENMTVMVCHGERLLLVKLTSLCNMEFEL